MTGHWLSRRVWLSSRRSLSLHKARSGCTVEVGRSGMRGAQHRPTAYRTSPQAPRPTNPPNDPTNAEQWGETGVPG